MRVVPATGGEIILGEVEATPTIGMTDFSRRVTDDFGVTTIVPRGFSRRLSVRLMVPTDNVDSLQRQLAALRASAATWIADETLAWLQVRGFFKEFQIDVAVPPTSFCTLSVEGLAEMEVGADDGSDPAPEGEASTLRVLQPTEISDSQLAASSVAENDAADWSAGTTYAVGSRVIRQHRVFESLVAPNTGQDPLTTPGAWLDTGPTNRWAMFDQALGTATTAQNEIAVRLTAGSTDAVALLDVVGTSVRVQGPGYSRTLPVTGGAVTFLDMPLRSGEVTVRVTGSGTVSVGTLLIGRLADLGVTEAAPTASITDFSKKEVDDFGEVTVVERAWAKRMSARGLLRTEAVDAVADRLARARAVPSLWIADEGLDSLIVYGVWKDWSVEVGDAVSSLALDIQGISAAAKLLPLPGSEPTAWPDILDPDGTKPSPNADVTGDNVAKDTAAVAGRPAAEIRAAAEAALDAAEALALTVTAQDGRITAARNAADTALDGVAAANTRIDSITAGGDVGDLTARVETLEAAEVTQDSAIAGVRQIIEAGSNSNAALRASISDQSVALYDLDQSVTDRFTTLRSTYGGNLSQLSDRITTVSDAQGSIVQRTTTLESRVDNLSAGGGEDARVPAIIARLDGTEFARTTALNAEAGRVSDALTRIGTAEGRLNSTEFARSTATNALATRATNVEARAGNLESTVGIQQTAIADAANKLAAARLTLKTAAGPGTEAEIELASDQSGGGRIRFGGNSTFVGAVEVQSADARGSTRLTSANYEVRDPNGQVRVRLGLY